MILLHLPNHILSGGDAESSKLKTNIESMKFECMRGILTSYLFDIKNISIRLEVFYDSSSVNFKKI